jgi:hypothetical protein
MIDHNPCRKWLVIMQQALWGEGVGKKKSINSSSMTSLAE